MTLLGHHHIHNRRARWLLACSCSTFACASSGGREDTSLMSASADMPAAATQASPAATTPKSESTPVPAATSGTPSTALTSAAGASGALASQGAAGASLAPDDADSGTASSEPSLCSGCAQEIRDPMDMKVHLHHIHLNVQDPQRSEQFYEKYFHAQRVLLNGVTPALHVAPTLILLEQHDTTPDPALPTALQHMGWGAADTGAWYTNAHAQGIEPDTRGFTSFNTNDTPTLGEPGTGAIIGLASDLPACFPVPDTASYMYVLGPDQERIEVWSGVDGRVNHVHFTTADLAATADWYQKFLGVTGSTPLLSYTFFMDDIVFYFEPIGAAADYKPTDDHVLGHIGLAVSDVTAWRKRAAEQNIQVVAEPAAAHGFTSFFVRGPDGLLIELVQAAKYAELCPR